MSFRANDYQQLSLNDKLMNLTEWNCQEKCSRINPLNSIRSYAARSVSSCNNLYTAGG